MAKRPTQPPAVTPQGFVAVYNGRGMYNVQHSCESGIFHLPPVEQDDVLAALYFVARWRRTYIRHSGYHDHPYRKGGSPRGFDIEALQRHTKRRCTPRTDRGVPLW